MFLGLFKEGLEHLFVPAACAQELLSCLFFHISVHHSATSEAFRLGAVLVKQLAFKFPLAIDLGHDALDAFFLSAAIHTVALGLRHVVNFSAIRTAWRGRLVDERNCYETSLIDLIVAGLAVIFFVFVLLMNNFKGRLWSGQCELTY